MCAVPSENENRGKLDISVFGAAMNAINEKAPVVLITGRAGTGKTTLIKKLLMQSNINQAVIAPTGVAALQAGGQTIHSFFRMPPHLQNLNELKPIYGPGRDVIKNLDRLIIDEISMVRADLVDKIDYALRLTRKKQQPFGGVQIIMTGDFHQLPPVTKSSEGFVLQQSGYNDLTALGARCFETVPVARIELQKVFRQTDSAFIELLGHIRSGQKLAETLGAINEKCVGPHRAGHAPLILTARNDSADKYNKDQLAALKGTAQIFTGQSSGQFNLDGDQLPAPSSLELKEGARVMLLKNDAERRWVNGSLATVIKMTGNQVKVRLDNSNEIAEIESHNWERMRYNWHEEEKRVSSEMIGSYTQLPLKLAWASTIHKAQGITLDDVRIDLGGGAFANGQAYVALSRARTIEGLSLVRPLTARDVMTPRI